jgi:L-lactate dehydrogenase complex protein LldG
MNEKHQELLAKLERESRAKQASFMDGISQRLGRPRPVEPPAHPYRGAPSYWAAYSLPLEERVRLFMDNFVSVGGHATRVEGRDAAAAFIVGKAREMNARIVLRQDEDELEALGLEAALPAAQVLAWNTVRDEDWRARAAEADFGVVQADFAVAYTGSVTVLSDKRKGRSVSLLPTVLFVLLPLERLHTRLGEVLSQLDARGRGGLPAGIHFISGPSRSADIENDLTIGVHGPGVVYAVLMG